MSKASNWPLLWQRVAVQTAVGGIQEFYEADASSNGDGSFDIYSFGQTYRVEVRVFEVTE